MGKQFFIFTVLAAFVFCGCNSKKGEASKAEESTFGVEALMEVADQQLEKEVVVQGIVTHVCTHSGKKCFISNEEGTLSMQVMAGGEIGSFDQELIGSLIQVKGIVKESRRTNESIDELEQNTLEMQESGEASHDECASSLNSIKQMREWMEKHNKDYYAIYYVTGEAFEVVD